MRPLSYGLLLVSLTLATACSDPEPVQRPTAPECESEEGDACTCPDGSEGELQCASDESKCSCSDEATGDDGKTAADEAGDDSAPLAMRDAGKAAPAIDAGKVPVDAKPDAGAPDAAVVEPLPPPLDTSRPDPAMLPKPTGTCPDFKEGTVTFKGQRFQIYVGDDGESKW